MCACGNGAARRLDGRSASPYLPLLLLGRTNQSNTQGFFKLETPALWRCAHICRSHTPPHQAVRIPGCCGGVRLHAGTGRLSDDQASAALRARKVAVFAAFRTKARAPRA